MNPEDQQDRIDDYLSGRLADAESFERELAANPQLQSDMEATRMALDAIHLSETDRLKDRLRGLEAGLQTGQAPAQAKVVSINRNRNRSWMGYAAAASVLLLVAAFFVLRPGTPDNAALAMANFEPYANLAMPITKGGSSQADRAAAYIAYERGDFPAAETAFRAYDSAPAEEAADRFYLAQTLLAQEKFSEASPIFTELAANRDFQLRQESEYYGALSQLGLGERDRARIALERISADANHEMYTEAVRLLDEL